MTYSQFHYRFNGPLLAIAAAVSCFAAWNAATLATFAVILAIVVAFTTPWDNYAVHRGIWDFPDQKYFFRIWLLPVEEYLFFVVQSAEVLLFCHGLAGPGRLRRAENPDLRAPGVLLTLLCLALAWLAVGLWSRRGFPRRAHKLYHHQFLFGPVLALQLTNAAPAILANGVTLALATGTVGLWLSAADLVAVRHGIWDFDESQTLGWKWRGRLPVEEILFFFVTSLLVAQSYVMLAPVASGWFAR